MSTPSPIATQPGAEERSAALTSGIIDENDADVLMAVKALGDMRSQGAAACSSPTSGRSDAGMFFSAEDWGGALILCIGTSNQATPALSRSQTSSDSGVVSESDGGPVQAEVPASGDFVSRVSTLPLVTSMLSAYSQSKASSRVVKVGLVVIFPSTWADYLLHQYGAQMVESSVKTISKPVMNRLPTAQLDEFACRQLDRVSG